MIIRLRPGIPAKALTKLKRGLTGLLPGCDFTAGKNFITVSSPTPRLFSEHLAGIENLAGVASTELSLKETCPMSVTAPPPDLAAFFKGSRRKDFMLIAGPCAVEDELAYLAAAKKLKAAGVCALRAALFKPRTSPYAFQGIGAKGFPIIKKARKATGLTAVTEAVSPGQLVAIKRTCGAAQIGARNMRNYELLKAAGAAGIPVILKRAPGATLKEWLLSAEYILKHGNSEIILCERGDSYSKPDKRGLNLAILREALAATSLPVIADPSHATGDRALVPAQAIAAVKAGADGLLIEASANPGTAMVDGRQTLSIPELSALLGRIKKLRAM